MFLAEYQCGIKISGEYLCGNPSKDFQFFATYSCTYSSKNIKNRLFDCELANAVQGITLSSLSGDIKTFTQFEAYYVISDMK